MIGPLGNDQHDMLGPWWGQGRDGDAVSVFDGIKAQNPSTTFTQGCTVLDKDPPSNTPADECGSDAGFPAAVAAANAADQVVLALGESRGQSGEAASRSEIDLPGKQQELIDAIKATGKPFVMVLFNGRPLTLTKVDASSPAILEAWFPGVEAGNAVADVLFGKVTASVDVANSGDRKGDDVVQVYIHDPVASISHPVRRLRGFQRVTLAPGESQTVSFTLDKSDFGFYDNRGKLVVEPGSIDVFAGDSSSADLEQSFTVAAEASTPHTSEPQKGPKTGPGPVDLGGRAASTI